MAKAVKHLQIIVSARVNWFFKADEQDHFEAWIRDVIDRQGMEIMAGPTSCHLDEPGLEGWSGNALIKTSDVAVHVWDAEDPIRLEFDMYTCGDLNELAIFQDLMLFGAQRMHILILDRENGIKVVEDKIVYAMPGVPLGTRDDYFEERKCY